MKLFKQSWGRRSYNYQCKVKRKGAFIHWPIREVRCMMKREKVAFTRF
jgi:hypothetical protein